MEYLAVRIKLEPVSASAVFALIAREPRVIGADAAHPLPPYFSLEWKEVIRQYHQ